MRAAIFQEPRSITTGDRPDPSIVEPTDAIVRVVLACVCGSDLWYYRKDFDHETDLEGIADAYAAMDERRAIKSLVRVGTI